MSIEYDGVGVDGSLKKPYSTFTFTNYSNIYFLIYETAECRIRVISTFFFNWFHLL